MTPLHFMMQMSQTFATATLKAQSAWWDASLASADKLTRVHEIPEDAAARAMSNSEAGRTTGWYRPPAATWSEISDKASGAHPLNAMMNAAGWPTSMFASPVAYGGASMFQSPFLGMMMTAPFSIPGLFGALPGLSMKLTDGTMLKADFDAQPDVAAHHASSSPVGSEVARNGATTADMPANVGEAVASITMPDNTVYKITIPMNGPLPFWPWASGFGAGSHASQPVIEGTASEDKDD